MKMAVVISEAKNHNVKNVAMLITPVFDANRSILKLTEYLSFVDIRVGFFVKNLD